MTDTYTPTTEQVRNHYVHSMRQAFIASAGEHEVEFDTWLSGVIREAKAEQREVDARIAYMVHYAAECSTDGPLGPGMQARSNAGREIAAAIRAGGSDDTPKATDASDDWVDPEPWWYPVRLNRTAHKLAQTNAQYRPRTREQWEADDTRKAGESDD